jgi:hypothetical protein
VYLIPLGHPNALDYTPRELKGWVYFHQRLEKRQRKADLALHAAAARGDPKKVEKTIKEKERD